MRRTAIALAGLLSGLVLLSALAGAQTLQPPPPTPVPVPPSGSPSPSPFPTVLHTPAPSTAPPEIRAGAAVLSDLDSGQVLYAKNADERRPIASLTKIMTALLVLERARPTDVVTVSADAAAPSPARSVGLAELGLRPEERIAVGELLYALLLQSANDAAVALAEHVSGTVEGFVAAMNAQAKRLALRHTKFLSPSGLDDGGYSSARDLATLTRAAYRLPAFAEVVGTKFHDIPSPSGLDRHIQNRNVLLWLYPGAIGVKTGFTSAAGFCVVAAAERYGRRLLAVVLGEPGEPFSDAAALLNYGFDRFAQRTLVTAGEPFGTVSIGGRPVPVSAGGGLAGLVPVGSKAVLRVRVDPRAAFPPARGEPVAVLTVSVPGLRLGAVPLVVSSVPPPPLPPPGPWWRRIASAALHAISGLLRALLD